VTVSGDDFVAHGGSPEDVDAFRKMLRQPPRQLILLPADRLPDSTI
jgi:hypothetical protein